MSDDTSPSPRARLLIAGLVVLLVLVIALRLSRKGDPAGASSVASAAASSATDPRTSPVPGLSFSHVGSLYVSDPAVASFMLPAPSGSEGADVWRKSIEHSRDHYVEMSKYPPSSQPLAGKVDLLKPNFVEPWFRSLKIDKDGARGKVGVTQWQSKVWLADGETAVATFHVEDDKGVVRSVGIVRAALVEDAASQPGAEIDHLSFHDDGVAPDEAAGDGTWSAFVPATTSVLTGKSKSVLGVVDLDVEGEQGALLYHFVAVGSPPAKFTGVVHDAIEQGSLAFHLGVDVYRPGRYQIVARVFDAKDQPAAFLTELLDLSVETREVVLVAFGKTLRDQDLTPPFAIKDVEGIRVILGAYPDRELMQMLPGPIWSATFPITLLSTDEWDSSQRWKQVDNINKVLTEGPPPPPR